MPFFDYLLTVPHSAHEKGSIDVTQKTFTIFGDSGGDTATRYLVFCFLSLWQYVAAGYKTLRITADNAVTISMYKPFQWFYMPSNDTVGQGNRVYAQSTNANATTTLNIALSDIAHIHVINVASMSGATIKFEMLK